MEITVVQLALEGMIDDDYQPIVYGGHLNKEQCEKITRELGSGYPSMSIRMNPEQSEPAFLAVFSNEEEPELDEDGIIDPDYQGHLSLTFYHTKLKTELTTT
jgi:hypothetical protein